MIKRVDYRHITRSYGTILAGIAVTIVFAILRPDAFATWANLINITRQISLLVIIAIGATLVMSIEEFDLSVGAMASLGGVLAAKMAVAGFPMILCCLLAPVVAFTIGFINGWIVTRFRVLSL